MSSGLEKLVNLERYPILDLESPSCRQLVSRFREQVDANGVCLLHEFISVDVLDTMVEQTEQLIPLANYYASNTTTAYQETVPLEDTGPHPRKTVRATSNHVLAYDLIPAGDYIRTLYESEDMLAFVAAVLGIDELHRYADPLGALNLAVNMKGDSNGWHFDQCDFVTSLLLREANRGGLFQCVPRIRDQTRENYDRVKRVLDGERDGVLTLPLRAGSLSIFKGRHSIHRVTEIESDKPRLIALLGYDTKPGVTMTQSASRRRFGRVA